MARKKRSITDENDVLKDCILQFVVGKKVGSGAFRRVYRMGADDRVLKVEYCGKEFCNINEAKVWKAVEGTPLEDWFAPVIDIDLMGVALIMRRTKPFKSNADFKMAIEALRGGVIPSFLDDVHYGNFGMLDGQVVCHDYGFTHFLDEAVKFKWQNLEHDDVAKDTDKTIPQEVQLELAL